ncbi:glycosyl transferase [Stenotrophomonas panacihumi]|uniref:Glycosyl transferase n=1 Tax=Stenotrophomonas panacihumi TaxID=676599 RepID=A0A0R0AHX0_9GAMM|nr:glycosyltransferase family 4 protein [Stenotrophomonas panacihumi]KRG44637.1 glycosyl transferase [Stenotrophomonas panacihumi]PTN55008.1 glycosyltransferase family 1 protein [Stenotrophomonas panacihumi]
MNLTAAPARAHRDPPLPPGPPLSILHSEAATGFGGQETYLYRHLLAMRQRGHQVTLLCQPDAPLGRRARAAGIEVIELPMGGPLRLVAGIARARRLLRERRFDVVNTTSRRDTLIVACAARLARIGLVVRSRHLMSPVNSLLTYALLPHRVLTVSEHVRQLLVQRGVRGERIGVVPPAVAALPWFDAPAEHAWSQRTQARARVRRELGFGAGDLLVGCVAVLRPPKGHAELIEAIAPLCLRHPCVQLLLVGHGDAARRQLQLQCQAHGIQAQVHFLGYRRDACELMPAFDVFALATRREAAGTVLLEAAAAAVPIVATDVGGIPEMLERGGNALLSGVDDIAAMTQSLRLLVDHPGLRRRMGTAGWRWLRRHREFTVDGQAEATERLYRQWQEERHGSR